jgi:hypothetical protein
MKNRLWIFLTIILIAGSFGISIQPQKARADAGVGCFSPDGQKTQDGNGPNVQDMEGSRPDYHCNSWVNIDYVQQSGNILNVYGTIEGCGILSFCESQQGGGTVPYVSEADGVLPETAFSGPGSGYSAYYYPSVTNSSDIQAYDGQGNPVSLALEVGNVATTGDNCQGPIDYSYGGGGEQYYAAFSYQINLSSGYQNGHTYTTYIHIVPTNNGYYDFQWEETPVPYTDNYQQYSYQQCAAMGWSSTEDCRDYWSYYRFTPTGLTPTVTTGTINVTADRSSASWNIIGAANFSGTGTSKQYNGAQTGTYSITDAAYNPLSSDGYAVTNTGTALRNTPLFARIINTAEASTCTTSYTCNLTAGGNINYNLASQYCSLTIQSKVNGTVQPLSGLNYYVNGLSTPTITSTPQTIQILADPTKQSLVTVSDSAPPTSWNGYTLDSDPNNSLASVGCQGNSSATAWISYVTRAKLQVK